MGKIVEAREKAFLMQAHGDPHNNIEGIVNSKAVAIIGAMLMALTVNALAAETENFLQVKGEASIIWGTGDRLTGMNQAAALWKWPGSAELVTVDSAGHMPQVERPKEFMDAFMQAPRMTLPACPVAE